MTHEELADLEVPIAYVKRHWHNAITVPRCQHRAVMRRLGEISIIRSITNGTTVEGLARASLHTHAH